MAYCKNCGAPIDDRAVICPSCGVAQDSNPPVVDNGGFGWGLLGCCLPIVGLILFLVWKDQKPKTAKAAGIGALAAKEVFVSQLGILYAQGETDEESIPLREQLVGNYSPLQGFCIMLFCLLSIPCLATLAIMRRELNSWKLTIAEAGGLFLLAYAVTFAVYQTATLLGIGVAPIS